MKLVLLAGGAAGLLLLGVVQGATEFLPVSSSGHLVIAREWLGLGGEGSLSREIALHFGTLLAVIVFCARDLLAMVRGTSPGLWRLVAGATVVTGAIALPARHFIEEHLNDLVPAGCGLLVTTLLLVVVAPKDDLRQTRSADDGTLRDALVLGLFQSLALVPGVSRAGATIVGALLLGYRRPDAVRAAFLISIPAVGGAWLLDTVGGDGAALAVQPAMIAATVAALVVGLGALRFLRARVDARSLAAFGLYTLALGLAAIASGLLGRAPAG